MFDISELVKPKEIAYYVAPTRPRSRTASMASAFAMSKPAFAPSAARSGTPTGPRGFNVLRIDRRVWPAGAGECLPRRMRIGRTGIGRIRLGMSKRTLLRTVATPVRRGSKAYRWCIDGSRGKRVSATFDSRGRVTLVTSTSNQQSSRRIKPGSSARRLRRVFRRRKTLIRGVVRAHKRSRLLFGVRRGRVDYVGVSSRSLLKSGRSVKRHLRYAGVVNHTQRR